MWLEIARCKVLFKHIFSLKELAETKISLLRIQGIVFYVHGHLFLAVDCDRAGQNGDYKPLRSGP